MIGHRVRRARREQRFADFTVFFEQQVQRIDRIGRNRNPEPPPHIVEYEKSLNVFDRIEREQGIAILPREEFDLVSR